MRFIPLALLFALPALAPAQDGDEAKKQFLEMDQRLAKAKSVSLGFSVELEVGGKPLVQVKGSLAFGEGDRARLEVEGKAHGEDTKVTMVSDGKRMRLTSRKGQVKRTDVATPKNLRAALVRVVSRAGLFLGLDMLALGREQELQPASLFLASDLKLGAREKVGEREAQVITYKVYLRGNDAADVTLWVDPLTRLPLKRVITHREGQTRVNITELYAGIKTSAKLDVKQFELPK
jgi:outer membrane lipoprotein-sorting protein